MKIWNQFVTKNLWKDFSGKNFYYIPIGEFSNFFWNHQKQSFLGSRAKYWNHNHFLVFFTFSCKRKY